MTAAAARADRRGSHRCEGGTIACCDLRRACPRRVRRRPARRRGGAGARSGRRGGHGRSRRTAWPPTAVGEHLEAASRTTAPSPTTSRPQQPGYRGWRWSVTLACATTSADHGQRGRAAAGRRRAGRAGLGAVGGAGAARRPRRRRPAAHPPRRPAARARLRRIATIPPSRRSPARSASAAAACCSREGRDAAAERWHDGAHGPGADMARGRSRALRHLRVLLPLAGSLRGAFGVCGNAYAPADGDGGGGRVRLRRALRRRGRAGVPGRRGRAGVRRRRRDGARAGHGQGVSRAGNDPAPVNS